MPLNFTAVVPVKFTPVITTSVPTAPLVGVKLVICGLVTLKTLELAELPTGVVTVINPVVEPMGTERVIFFEETTVNGADKPFSVTDRKSVV